MCLILLLRQAILNLTRRDDIDRELKSLAAEKDRQRNALTKCGEELHEIEKKQADLKGKLREKTSLEEQIKSMKEDIESAASTIKELDTKISDLDPAIERLEQEHQVADQELSEKIARARSAAQDINSSIDKLDAFKRTIERYVRDKRDRRLKECTAKIEELVNQLAELDRKRDEADKEGEGISKEIHESTATLSNLRDNIRARKLVKDITNTQAEINQYDIEEAAKAKRLFEERYMLEMDKETELQGKVLSMRLLPMVHADSSYRSLTLADRSRRTMNS